MRTLFTFVFVVISLLSVASEKDCEFINAELVFVDGQKRLGFAKHVAPETEVLSFRKDNHADVEEIDCSKLIRITYFIGDKVTELDRIKIYNLRKKIQGPLWMEVVERGYATLYMNISIYSAGYKKGGATFKDYYCLRPGEPAATKVSIVADFNNNAYYRKNASKYFKDYYELACKIKSKVYRYKDLIKTVQEYNAWILQNKQD